MARLLRKVGESEKAESNDLFLLDNEAKFQRLEMQIAHDQAKVAQESAIAKPTKNAHEVIIEEYYEGESKGQLGVTGGGRGLTVGASVEGKRIIKRVYKFIGGSSNRGGNNIIDIEND